MPEALQDLQSVRRYIAQDKPDAAKRVVMTIATAVEMQLTAFPETGRPGRIDGTRELVIAKTPFIVPYRIKDQEIQILAVHHSARRWPEAF